MGARATPLSAPPGADETSLHMQRVDS